MRAFVDKDVCIGCGACIITCPDVFQMDDELVAVAIEDEIIEDDLQELAVDASEGCPVDAITVE